MSTFTQIHVAISLIGILSGLVMLGGLLGGHRLQGWTALFLATTVATSVTGFFYFPFRGFTPAQGFGLVSMVLLLLALYGLHGRGLAGSWRLVFVIASVAALYLNVFVLIVQMFEKIPSLKAAAPTHGSPLFMASQSIVLIIFIVAGILAARRFQNDGRLN